MMSSVLLETCSALNKLWNNKFYYKDASCWYFYCVIYDACIHEYQNNALDNAHQSDALDNAHQSCFDRFILMIITILLPTMLPTLLYLYLYTMIYDMIYLLTATGLSPGGSSTVHIYTQTIHRTAQITTNTEVLISFPFTLIHFLAFK